MASGEIYEFKMRFESDNTSFLNVMHFQQGLDAPAGKTGATFLIDAAEFPSSIFTFFLSKMTPDVSLVCCEARKAIPDGSGQTPEYDVKFFTDKVGLVAGESLPIDSTLVYKVVGIEGIPGKRAPVSMIYVSGVPESYANGVFSSEDVQSNINLTDDYVMSVPSSEGSGSFRIGVRSDNAEGGFFTPAFFIDVPCFPSKRNTRKRRLC